MLASIIFVLFCYALFSVQLCCVLFCYVPSNSVQFRPGSINFRHESRTEFGSDSSSIPDDTFHLSQIVSSCPVSTRTLFWLCQPRPD